jgi:predicted DNA-binding transcriptional regulator AlpA
MPELTPSERREQMLLSYDDLRLFGINYSREHLSRRMKEGTFPRAVALGRNRVAWRREEIIAFIESLPVVDGGVPHLQRSRVLPRSNKCLRLGDGPTELMGAGTRVMTSEIPMLPSSTRESK